MDQQQKNTMIEATILFLADVYEVEKLHTSKMQEIALDLFGSEYCVPHPIQVDVFWPIGLILTDLRRRRWRNKRIAKWLNSLIYEEKALVVTT